MYDVSDKTNEQMVDWRRVRVTLQETVRRFIVEAVRGGYQLSQDDGDICVDNFELDIDPCPAGS